MDTGNTAYVLGSAALVMLMTPGLAFFYGGMVRARSVLNMMMMCMVCLGVVTIIWVSFGFSLAFGDSHGGLIGGFEHAGLRDTAAVVGGVPLQAFAMFQLMFAVVTAALLASAAAERTRFWPWVLFVGLWTVLVYVPLAHWIFDFDGYVGGRSGTGGWMANSLKALDFAGGTAVEINSGASGLALALVLGARAGWPREPMRPHNLPAVMLGAGLLWFGWFGFNAGSALAAGTTAANAFVTTITASAAAVMSWLALEHRLDGRPSSFGAASAAIAGLVGITPACGFVDTFGALAIGGLAGVVCQLAIRLKYRLGYDDALDVVAIHGVAGVLGMLAIGLFGSTAVNSAGANGLFYGGGLGQLLRQAVAAGVTLVYALTVTMVIAWLVRATVGFRVHPVVESSGIDEAEHAETGYEFSALSTSVAATRAPLRADTREETAR